LRNRLASATRFTKAFAETSPDKPGVYVFWRVTAIGTFHAIYVGMSQSSIRSRLRKHYEKSHNDGLSSYIRGCRADLLCCWGVVAAGRAKAVESRLIRKLKPLTNLSQNK
jgi:hypothetical protein